MVALVREGCKVVDASIARCSQGFGWSTTMPVCGCSLECLYAGASGRIGLYSRLGRTEGVWWVGGGRWKAMPCEGVEWRSGERHSLFQGCCSGTPLCWCWWC